MVLAAEDGCNHPRALVLTLYSYVGGGLVLGRFGACGTRILSVTQNRDNPAHLRLDPAAKRQCVHEAAGHWPMAVAFECVRAWTEINCYYYLITN